MAKVNLLNVSLLCLELNEQPMAFCSCGQVADTEFGLKSVIFIVNHGNYGLDLFSGRDVINVSGQNKFKCKQMAHLSPQKQNVSNAEPINST